MRIGRGFDQLHIHAHLFALFLHAAFEDVRDAELPCDLRQIFRRAFEALRRGARDDFQIGDLRQPRQNFILHAFGKVSVLRIVAEIFERQDRDRFRDRDGPPRHPPSFREAVY